MGRRGGIIGQAKLELRRSPERDRPHGIDANWAEFKSNPMFGVKSFDRKVTRDKSERIGKMLAKENLHPQIFASFEYEDERGDMWYALVMERVPHTSASAKNHCKFVETFIEEQIEEKMIEECAKLGVMAYDVHVGNVGQMSDGRWVVLDVGHFET